MEHEHAEFVDTHYAELVERVSPVMPIADKLFDNGSLTWGPYSQITNATPKETQIKELLNAVKSRGPAVKSAFYRVLQEIQPHVIQELEGSSTQTNERHVTESHRQEEETKTQQNMADGPEDNVDRWNPISIKYKSKIEELQKDASKRKVGNLFLSRSTSTRHSAKIKDLLRETDKEKVGNLYFCKAEEYLIGSGGSGTQVYIGVSEDGIEVAIKLITKNPKNNKDFENEVKHLQDLKLESKYIVRYVTFAEGKDFYYLANQLCEYDLEDYMENLRQQERNDKENILKKIVKEMLLGLQVLHHAGVIHRDIKPKNVLIDKEERARLADFGISRKLEEGKTTVYTDRAGTRGWEATEIVNQTKKGRYKQSSDIQVAGMLTYYIISDGKHPFGEVINRERNILEGEYCLNDVQDKKVKDLVEWMISKDQSKRPMIDKVLDHPYFWDDKRIREVLHNLGNKEEVQEYKNYESNKKLYDTVQKYTEGKTFSEWRSKAPETWTKIGKSLPNDLLGLLRHLRNALGHQEKQFYDLKMIDQFPDFLLSLHRLATEMGWEY